jgi:hypothetical protein
MAPRQKGPQDARPPVLGQPVYAQPYYPAPPMVLTPRPQIGGAFGGGGVMQMARNVLQHIRQYPQQLQQLAHQFSHYPSHTMQHALHAARPFGHRPHAGVRPPMFIPQPPIPVGIPLGRIQAPAVPAKRVEEPMVLIPRPQIQGAAQQFGAQAQAFDPVALNKQIAQLGAQMLQTILDGLRQSFQAPVALAHQGGGGAAAAAVASPVASPPVAAPGGGPGKLKQD